MSDSDEAADRQYLEALDRFLEELRREFRANPEFAHRVVRALGASVTFESELAARLVNVRELAASGDEAGFHATLGRLSFAELKAVAKESNLATSVDMKGLSQPALLALLYSRARDKASERQWQG
jgi:hypothetical protein